MQEFPGNARGKVANNGGLAFGKGGGQLSHSAGQFLLAHLLHLPPQITDGIHHAQRAQPAFKSVRLFGDDGLDEYGFLRAQANAFIDGGLHIVQIIYVDTRQCGNLGVHVARQGNIYQQ